VRQALVDGVPIEVVSELAGHASINTTWDLLHAGTRQKSARGAA